MTELELALADQFDQLIEQTPTAMPDDVPADHALDPEYDPNEVTE